MLCINKEERKVLIIIAESAIKETGGQFTTSDQCDFGKLTKHQVAGYIASLAKKNYILSSPLEHNKSISQFEFADWNEFTAKEITHNFKESTLNYVHGS